ncbi:MAG TPA: DUF1697 domain-containing protein [Gaiellaceae bacterium]|jgi:uncharacterized protein (DUF1697 family)|nr:DUF1697 domain-containing protein [Gaiellaceae bacterium]
MAIWVALLRAVNLGARNKVPMAALREALEAEGFATVQTYIASGNVVYEHAKAEPAAIERVVAREFGVKTVVFVRSRAQIRRLAASHPFGDDTSRSFVAFLDSKPSAKAVRALRETAADDEAELVGGDLVLRYPGGYQSATLTAARLEKALGVAATSRNWRTVAALAELVG